MIEIKTLGYQIRDKWLVKDVSYVFETGKIHMLCGPNGAGKSTLLKLLALEKKPHTGTIYYEGVPVNYDSRLSYAKQRAVLSQHTDIGFPMKVSEIIMMGRYPHFKSNPTKKDHQICDEVMEELGLNDFKNRNYLTLSGGEQQRVQFARVLTQLWDIPSGAPRMLLLDEPIASLDLRHQFDFLHELKKFMDQRTTVIAILHDLNLALNYGDEALLLSNGQLFASGKPAAVLNPENIKNVFHVDSEIQELPSSKILWVKERI